MTRFPDTRGSLVAAVKSGDGEERARALETLAEAYWRPIYAYVRLNAGRSHEEAADLTQEFFARLVEKDWLKRFDSSKARLRTYLRVLVDGLVANESKARNRLKRGGGIQVLSLDFEVIRREVEERRREGELSPEDFFEKEWVRSVFSLAVTRLRDRYTTSGHEKRFRLFSAFALPSRRADRKRRNGCRRRRVAAEAVSSGAEMAVSRCASRFFRSASQRRCSGPRSR